jgi:glycosyltransferase involved in cell wall biosynthesis
VAGVGATNRAPSLTRRPAAVKILHLATGTNVGGAEMQVLVLSRAFQRRGHDVQIVSLTRLGPIADEARRSGITTTSLEMARGVPDPRGLVRLVRLLRAWHPDVLHSHMTHANILGRLAGRLAGTPVVISTIHSANLGSLAYRLGYRWTDRFATLTTAITPAAATLYREAGAVRSDRLRVIPNGVDLDRFRKTPGEREHLRRLLALDDGFVWLAVGRFNPAKDYPTLIAAFARVVAAVPQATLVIAGDGPDRAAAERAAERIGGGEGGRSVRFLGVRDDVPALMLAADAYVMSSAWEGLPLVLLEAAAMGLPIVTTAVGGTPEVVLDRQSGALVPPRNPSALADAMLDVMRRPHDHRRAMGERGRAHVRRHFALDHVVDIWERTYEELVECAGVDSGVRSGIPAAGAEH